MCLTQQRSRSKPQLSSQRRDKTLHAGTSAAASGTFRDVPTGRKRRRRLQPLTSQDDANIASTYQPPASPANNAAYNNAAYAFNPAEVSDVEVIRSGYDFNPAEFSDVEEDDPLLADSDDAAAAGDTDPPTGTYLLLPGHGGFQYQGWRAFKC